MWPAIIWQSPILLWCPPHFRWRPSNSTWRIIRWSNNGMLHSRRRIPSSGPLLRLEWRNWLISRKTRQICRAWIIQFIQFARTSELCALHVEHYVLSIIGHFIEWRPIFFFYQHFWINHFFLTPTLLEWKKIAIITTTMRNMNWQQN